MVRYFVLEISARDQQKYINMSLINFWMGGGLESRCVGRVYGAALKTSTHPKIRCRKPYAATQHLMLLMMGVCTRNMSS